MFQALRESASTTSSTPAPVTLSIWASVISTGGGLARSAASAVDPAAARPNATKVQATRFMGTLLYVGGWVNRRTRRIARRHSTRASAGPITSCQHIVGERAKAAEAYSRGTTRTCKVLTNIKPRSLRPYVPY